MNARAVEQAACPRCGSRRFATVQLELTEQPCREGEWGTTWIIGADTAWICRVACEACGHLLYDAEAALAGALDAAEEQLEQRGR